METLKGVGGETVKEPDDTDKRAMVRLAKTIKLAVNTQSRLQVTVDAEDGVRP
ncbi:hypothetical protein PF005_g3734 [Phytophthora fragariae]|uniref:Uncharacterized protein n=1 Tax=Phytophthora fragariae TaxID=53985 RepID=A0A6A3Z596_9STRA|nr:hypothetical protein PF005_g3734 [Phytophthora fragariae]